MCCFYSWIMKKVEILKVSAMILFSSAYFVILHNYNITFTQTS